MIEGKIEKRGRPASAAGFDPRLHGFSGLETRRELRQKVYDLTRRFPVDERHVPIAQIRRAAISVTANIAEGYGRFSCQENMRFCRHARASAYEVRDHLIAALDAGHIPQSGWKETEALAQRVILMLNGYLRAICEPQVTSKQG